MMGRVMSLVLLLTLTLGMAAWSEEIYCRYALDELTRYGMVQEDVIHEMDKAPWEGGKTTGHTVALNQVELLYPCEPMKIVGMSGTYENTWEDKEPFNTVRWFLKPPTSAASPDEEIELPASVDVLMVETELVIVIGKRVKNASLEEAKEAIFGYTICNDMVGSVDSYHKINKEPMDQEENLLNFGLKHGDKFTPFGPFIYRGVDWKDRERTLTVTTPSTGKKNVYKHNTSNLFYSPAKMVRDLSRVFTLEPGDIILTGTTEALPAKAGDVMEVSVEGLGTIVNTLVPREN